MYLHVFGATQLVYGSVTLARCASLPYGQSWILPLAAVCLISEFLCTVLPSRILGVRRCGWTYVAALHVHLTLRTKRCSESVVASLLHLLLPCLPGTLGGQEAIHKKKTHPQVCLQLNQQLPINPHCGFSFTASQFGKSYVRKKVMCGPHTSFHSSVASHPTLPTPSY